MDQIGDVPPGAGARSLTLLSITTNQGLHGALCLGYRGDRPASREDLVQVRRLADQVAVALSNVQMIEHLATERQRLEARTGELSHLNEALRDEIAERERAERALRASEEQQRQSQKLEAIGTLAGGVAHDFNNLLTVISSYTEMALDSVPSDQPLHEDLREVQRASQRAAALTRQLLAFSRKQLLQPAIIDLNGVVQGIDKMLRRLIGEDIELRTISPAEPALIHADPGQLEQIIVNLVVNARDAMPQGGRLLMEITEANASDAEAIGRGDLGQGPFVRLTVTDSGTGMDRGTQSRVFEPFFTTKEPGKGTGLGLSTVYGIVEQSGGAVHVASEPGVGTTFALLFPRASGTVTARTEAAPARAAPGRETILLVEDEAPLRRLAATVLARIGYRVLEAGDGEEALRLAERHDGPIHLILTDVVMPRISGKDLAERFWRRHGPTRVLYMSGYTEHAILGREVLQQSASFLSKPFLPHELAHKVRLILDGPAPVPEVGVAPS